MTDREYLKLAAKAARIEWADGHESTGLRNANGTFWNPITDDGDALRLAVRLDLNVMIGTVRTPCGFTAIEYSETGEKDDNECTRRAIVRAAAEIGRSMTCPPYCARLPDDDEFYDIWIHHAMDQREEYEEGRKLT